MPEEQAQPAQATIGFQITPESAIFSFNLGSGLSLRQELNAEAMQQICKMWLESRKALMKEQALVADAMRTKR
jgi:hypothetical protein